jgi:DNA-binding response OmpR family regulator
VVVLSGCKSTDLMVRSWELGVSVHVTKPVDPEVVAEAVARHLAPRSLALTS